MQIVKNKKPFHIALAAVMALSALTTLGFTQEVNATPLTQVQVRFDRMKANTFTSGMVCAMPNTVASTEGKVLVTFPTGFTVSSTTANWTTSVTPTSSWPTSAAPWPTIGSTATSASGQVVTFTSGDLTSGSTLYCFNWTDTAAALKQPVSIGASEVGSVATQTSGSAAIDSSSFATATITDDQIAVTATVTPVFSFTLSGNSDALGNLSTTAVSHSGTPFVVTVGTNAVNGYTVWAKSAAANGGLVSTAASYTIGSTCNAGTQVGTNTVLSIGAEGYNTGVTTAHSGGTGTITMNSVFDGTSTSRGGGLCGLYQRLGTSSGTAGADTFTLTNNASVSNATKIATDYADTITVVGAGLF